MSRSLHRAPVGLPTPRQRALVLLVFTNAHPRALHPITELHAALCGTVPLDTMWEIVSSLLQFKRLRAVGTNDRSAGFLLTTHGVTLAVREIEAEMTRPLHDHETLLRGDAERLGLKLPYRDLFRPPSDQVPHGCSGHGGGGNEEGQA